jgi:hypothetical protein
MKLRMNYAPEDVKLHPPITWIPGLIISRSKPILGAAKGFR